MKHTCFTITQQSDYHCLLVGECNLSTCTVCTEQAFRNMSLLRFKVIVSSLLGDVSDIVEWRNVGSTTAIRRITSPIIGGDISFNWCVCAYTAKELPHISLGGEVDGSYCISHLI